MDYRTCLVIQVSYRAENRSDLVGSVPAKSTGRNELPGVNFSLDLIIELD